MSDSNPQKSPYRVFDRGMLRSNPTIRALLGEHAPDEEPWSTFFDAIMQLCLDSLEYVPPGWLKTEDGWVHCEKNTVQMMLKAPYGVNDMVERQTWIETGKTA